MIMDNHAWIELNSDDRIAELMHTFGNFHDGCVREIHVETGHYVDRDLRMNIGWQTTAHLLVQRQFRNPSAIEMRFEGVLSLQFSPPDPDCDSIIFSATLRLNDGVLTWADHRGFCRIEARHACWRDASEWMGSDPRYRYPDSRR
jgi:hypothetical protein